jgi:hypothetical protein
LENSPKLSGLAVSPISGYISCSMDMPYFERIYIVLTNNRMVRVGKVKLRLFPFSNGFLPTPLSHIIPNWSQSSLFDSVSEYSPPPLSQSIPLLLVSEYFPSPLSHRTPLPFGLRVLPSASVSYTVLRPSHILLRKVSIYTRARTQKSCTVSQLVCAFPNPV